MKCGLQEVTDLLIDQNKRLYIQNDDTSITAQTNHKRIETFLEIVPTEIIYTIFSVCGVVGKHVLQFVCKQSRQIAHNCCSTENTYFFTNTNKIGYNFSISEFAALEGHLNILKWMHQCPLITFDLRNQNRYCLAAAIGGHLEVLKWARENGCSWDQEICSKAASNGHLEVLKWARRNGCPWDGRTCFEAASNLHFEVLNWARHNECPWDRSGCFDAATTNYSKMLKQTGKTIYTRDKQTRFLATSKSIWKNRNRNGVEKLNIFTRYMLAKEQKKMDIWKY
jgi:hypothetical protein